MADQLSNNMGNLSLDSGSQNSQMQNQQPPATRSYIPPHLRNKAAAANGPMSPSMNGAGGPPLRSSAMGGLNNSAWAG